MTNAPLHIHTADPARHRGMILVFLAGVLWQIMITRWIGHALSGAGRRASMHMV